eukprot:scaffold24122_cov112-Isochrysis_galbana.AAC.2
MTIAWFIGPSKRKWDAVVVRTTEEAVEIFLARPSAYLITSATRIPPIAPISATSTVLRDQPWRGSAGCSQVGRLEHFLEIDGRQPGEQAVERHCHHAQHVASEALLLDGRRRRLTGSGRARRARRAGLKRDEQDTEDQGEKRALLGLRECAAQEHPLEQRGEEDLGLLDDGKRAGVDPVERDEAEHVHRQVHERWDGHLGRVHQQPVQPAAQVEVGRRLRVGRPARDHRQRNAELEKLADAKDRLRRPRLMEDAGGVPP